MKSILIGFFLGSLVTSLTFLYLIPIQNGVVTDQGSQLDYKLKCSSFIESENKRVSELDDLSVNFNNQVTAPEIFYSPSLDTCLSAYAIFSNESDGFDSFYIEDLLTNNSVFTKGGDGELYGGKRGSDLAYEEFMKKVEELKK